MGLTQSIRNEKIAVGGVFALTAPWKSLVITNTSRAFNLNDTYVELERTLQLLLSLHSLRRQSRELDANITEAATIFSNYLGKVDAENEEQTRRLVGLVENLQSK